MKAFGTVVRTGAGTPLTFVIAFSVVGFTACSLPGMAGSGAATESGSDAGAGSPSGEGNDASGFPSAPPGNSNDAGGQTSTNDAGSGLPATGDAGGPDAAGQNNGPDAAGQNNGADAAAGQYTLTVTAPVTGATVAGTVVVSGSAPGFVNVEVWDPGHTSPPLARVMPQPNGQFSTTVDTTALANGPDTWTVWAWDSPAGHPANHSMSQPVAVTIANGAGPSPDAGAPDAATGGAVAPFGNIPGTWTLAFDDEFNGTSLDANKWTTMNGGGWSNTTCETANVSVSGGNVILTLASSSSGGCICTGDACGGAFGGTFSTGSGSYNLPVGGYTEARVNFPGSGTGIDNWPAWWTSGPGWPAAGEHDIAEGNGTLTANYHSPSGAANHMIAGTWSNEFHVYGLHRMANSADVYWDGQKVLSYPTDDNGAPESLLVDLVDGFGQAVYGAGSQVLVDYIRAWQ